jgi:hypothetical protein
VSEKNLYLYDDYVPPCVKERLIVLQVVNCLFHLFYRGRVFLYLRLSPVNWNALSGCMK